jgi:zinc protease
MAFNGTEAFPKNELVSQLQSLGAEFGPHINASTSFDETQYKLRLPTDKPENVELGLKILSEWASNVTFLPTDLDAERGVVLSEKRGAEGAQMRLTEKLVEEIFAGGRYAKRLPIGKPKILKTASAATLKRFYTDWYHPSNMAVIAVGDVDPKGIEKQIKERFSGLKAKENPRSPEPRILPKREGLSYLELSDAELPMSVVAFGRLFQAPRMDNMVEWEKSVREMLVASMLTKRLEEAKKKNDARYMMAGFAPVPFVRGAKAHAYFAMVNPQDPRGSLEDLLSEIERARRHGFTQGEFDRASKEIISAIRSSARESLEGKESSAALVAELARHHLTGEAATGRVMEARLMEHFVTKIKPQELSRELEGALSPEGMIAVSLGSAASSLLSKGDFEALLAGLPAKQLVPYADERSDVPLMSKLPQPGKVVGETEHKEAGVTEWKLSNGATVLVKETDFKADEILLTAVSFGGTLPVAKESVGPIVAASNLVGLGGLGEHDSIKLERALAGREVSASSWIDPYTEGVSASSSKQDLEAMFQLVHMRFVAPRKDEHAFKVWRDAKLQEVTMAYNQPERRFNAKLMPLRGDNNPRYFEQDKDFVEKLLGALTAPH